MATIKIKDLEMDADLDSEAMRKVCGGNAMFGNKFVSPVTGIFQHQSLAELFTNLYGDVAKIGAFGAGTVNPGGSFVSATHSATSSMARNVKG